MKVAMIFLVVLGVIAAGSAALLVQGFAMPKRHEQARQISDPPVPVVVATRPLKAMTVIDASAVTVKEVPRSKVPQHALGDPVQAMGKVLAVTLVEGQAFTSEHFAREGSPAQLAAALPPGMRAVSLLLNEQSGMAGLVYPGCIVDVLVSFTPVAPDGKEADDTVTTTLLQGLSVLAVGTRTVVTGDGDGKGDAKGGGTRTSRLVTLLVDPKQAETLQLATRNGSVSLTLRNPLDDDRVTRAPTRISELAEGYKFRVPPVAAPAVATPLPPPPAAAPPKEAAAAPPPAWETLIIRGGKQETRSFPLSSITPQTAASVGARN